MKENLHNFLLAGADNLRRRTHQRHQTELFHEFKTDQIILRYRRQIRRLVGMFGNADKDRVHAAGSDKSLVCDVRSELHLQLSSHWVYGGGTHPSLRHVRDIDFRPLLQQFSGRMTAAALP